MSYVGQRSCLKRMLYDLNIVLVLCRKIDKSKSRVQKGDTC